MKKQKNTHPSTLRWLASAAGKKKFYILFLLLIQTALSLGSICYALIFRGVIDAAVGGSQSGVKRWLLIFVFVAVFQVSMGALNRYLQEYTRASLENSLKERVLSYLLRCDYETITGIHSGEWMNRMTSDTVIVADNMTQLLPGFAGMMVRLAGALILLIIMYPLFGGLIIPAGILTAGISAILRKHLKSLHRKVQEADGNLRICLQESLSSMQVIRMFAKEGQRKEQAVRKMEDHKQMRMRRNHLSNLCTSGFHGAMNAAYVAGTAVGGYGILRGTISYGTLMAMIQLIGQLQSPIAGLTGFLPRYYGMLASADRLREIESYPENLDRGEEKSVKDVQAFYREKLNRILLCDAGFSYQKSGKAGAPRPVVLEKVNLEIPKGSYVALTGSSGCGKSTLLKVLMCLYPLREGKRLLQTEAGTLPLTFSWRGLFAYVPQGNHLMQGTIRETVTFCEKTEGRTETEAEERIWRALRIADAEDFVRALPEGLDTFLGEKGAGLSEGQMQRLAIARAVYTDHPILVLDESTSALDEDTERKVLCNLRRMTEKTVLIVTHRKAALDICDLELRFSGQGIVTYSRR